MHRIFVDVPITSAIRLTGDNLHYIRNVLRLNPKDIVSAFCGDGKDYICEIQSLSKKEGFLTIIDTKDRQTDPKNIYALLQGMPKSGKFERIIKDCTASGVTDILPFYAERSIGRRVISKTDRWRDIPIDACRQTGKTKPPKIHPIYNSIVEAIKITADFQIKLYLRPDSMLNLLTFLETQNIQENQIKVAIIVGPEGGLTQNEYSILEDSHFIPVTLGSRCFRTELAGFTALVILTSFLER